MPDSILNPSESIRRQRGFASMVKDRSQAIKPPRMQPAALSTSLKGWRQISKFLGQPTAVAQRWAGEGMPISKVGRYVTASPEELSRWLGRESGSKKPVHIATEDADLSVDLKLSLTDLKRHR
jgi:hypothetical protein